MFPCPGSAVELRRVRCVYFVCVCMCLFWQRPQSSGPQWHHLHIQLNEADNTGWLPAGTLQGLKKGSGCFLLMCVCVNPVITKPPLPANCPSKSIKTPERWMVLWIFCQSNANLLQSSTTRMEEVKSLLKEHKARRTINPWEVFKMLSVLLPGENLLVCQGFLFERKVMWAGCCGYTCGWATEIGLEFQ